MAWVTIARIGGFEMEADMLYGAPVPVDSDEGPTTTTPWEGCAAVRVTGAATGAFTARVNVEGIGIVEVPVKDVVIAIAPAAQALVRGITIEVA